MRTYFIDADIDGTPVIGSWAAKNKNQALQMFKDYYRAKGIPEQEIIIRNIKA